MSSINNKNKEEPNTAPQPDRWYNLSLGSTFKDHTSTKFCTLRYEFKPASIDKNQPGSLHKKKDNRVTVEFQNNQPGKPKLSFEGKGEDYKDNDAVLFFDGQNFRLERLHRAVKQLRHVRLPGESATAGAGAGASSVGPSMEARSPPLGKGAKNKALALSIPVEVERIDIGEPEILGAKPTGRGFDDYHHQASAPPNPSTTISLPDQKSDEMEEEQVDIDIDDINESVRTPNTVTSAAAPATEIGEFISGFDINLPTQNDMDDEIADVDVSDDETSKGPNAADVLRAQVNANTEGGGGGGGGQSSSSSGSSDSGSSSGSSSSSSSDSDQASDDDSVNSI